MCGYGMVREEDGKHIWVPSLGGRKTRNMKFVFTINGNNGRWCGVGVRWARLTEEDVIFWPT